MFMLGIFMEVIGLFVLVLYGEMSTLPMIVICSMIGIGVGLVGIKEMKQDDEIYNLQKEIEKLTQGEDAE